MSKDAWDALETQAEADVRAAIAGARKRPVADPANIQRFAFSETDDQGDICLLYTSPSPRDRQKSRMPSSA